MSTTASTEPYRDRTLPVGRRVDDLLGRMTLREKVGQVNQRLHGWELYDRPADGGPATLTRALDDEIDRFGGVGALYGLQRADPWSGRTTRDGVGAAEAADLARRVQERVRGRSRLGIPTLLVEEMPHGLQAVDGTVLPVNLAAASAWDPGLVHDAARAATGELRARGGHVALVSATDVLRDPRWGRAEETFGEDPYLASELTTAVVRGVQGGTGATGTFAPEEAAVVLKHVAGQGATVGGRNWPATELGWRELYEVHLPPVRAGVEAGAAGVMAAYNELEGVPCAASRRLLTGVLRGQLGFAGLVMADGQALDRLVRLTGDAAAAAARSLHAGTDLSLWDEVFPRLDEAVERGLVDVADLDAAVARVLTLKFRLGLFDEEARSAPPEAQGVEVVAARTREAAERLASAGVTLLQRGSGLLPLPSGRVAVMGPHAGTVTHLLGDYTAEQRPGAGTSLAAALGELAGPGTRVEHVPGATFEGAHESRDAAVALAGGADVAVLAIGGSSARAEASFDDNGAAVVDGRLTSMTCGEGVDLAGLRIGAAQLDLLRAVAATGTPVVTVVVGGRPHLLEEVLELSDTVLACFYPGIAGGRVLAEVLLGRRAPAGRLPATLPRRAEALPVAYNGKDHRSRGYVDVADPVLLPFGHGLGPVDAEITGLTLDRTEITRAELAAGARVRCTVALANPAPVAAPALVQAYLHRVTADAWPRTRELRGFARAVVPAGASATVTLELGARELEAVREDPAGLAYDVAAGVCEVQVGLSSRPACVVTLTIHP